MSPADRVAQTDKNFQVLMDGCEQRFRKGEKRALLAAINWCATFDRPIPPWAAHAFQTAFRRVAWEYEGNSWDDAFGVPFPNAKLPALRKRRKLEDKVFWRVSSLRARRPKPRGIFDTVAEEVGISVADCRALFYNFQRELRKAGKTSKKISQINRQSF